MTIGIFDSGIGGLTVLREAVKLLPNENYIYYADTRNVPYGIKTKEEVFGYIESAVDFLEEQGVSALVIACNTATSVAVAALRKKHSFPIIGMEPAVKPALNFHRNGKILVTATTLTLKEEKLEKLISSNHAGDYIDKLALDKLVLFAENFNFSGREIEEYIENKFKEIDITGYAAIVLGCTHFLYFKDILGKKIEVYNIPLIDGNEGTVRQLGKIMKDNNLLENCMEPHVTFYNSDGLEKDTSRLRLMNEIISTD